MLYLATEGAEGEGDDAAIAHHAERDVVAAEMKEIYEKKEDLMKHPVMSAPPANGEANGGAAGPAPTR